ncbi:MAG: NADH:flavin oxidoreductase [Candidatus Omnitrophica bacterium]|jgi:2,4-dienoyl-CoA reductase-like NADH-dependent reductase (Old Yellow Enzyme family)|nr:NADH:flavin oxidoreductase [Candidatus Omnitrophota bacterium]
MALLFQPACLGKMKLKNRVIRSATFENMADADGSPDLEILNLYKELAEGELGLIITGAAYVNKEGQILPLQIGAHDDYVMAKWEATIKLMHSYGTKIAVQVAHAGRLINTRFMDRRHLLFPSKGAKYLRFSPVREMTKDQIYKTISDFANAAKRIKKTGFDAVQIHAAHGYLISSFLSPITNRRLDEWGGDRDGRSRFLLEIYKAMREAAGADFPILCKLSVDDFVEGGIVLEEIIPVIQKLFENGLNALEISGGEMFQMFFLRGKEKLNFDYFLDYVKYTFISKISGLKRKPIFFQEAYFLTYAKRIKQIVNMPLILSGGIRDFYVAEKIIASGLADFISLSRPLICEPGLPNRWQAGERHPSVCRSCNRCLYGLIKDNKKLKCYY